MGKKVIFWLSVQQQPEVSTLCSIRKITANVTEGSVWHCIKPWCTPTLSSAHSSDLCVSGSTESRGKSNEKGQGDGLAAFWGEAKKAGTLPSGEVKAEEWFSFTKSLRWWIRWTQKCRSSNPAILQLGWEGYSLRLAEKWFKTDKRKCFFCTAVSEFLEFLVLTGCEGRWHQQV